MCEDCGAAAPGKALLSWMRRSELGERDLACACCGVALESGFYSPPFLLPRTASARDLDGCGYSQDDSLAACLHGDVVFVSDDGPVIELFDEKPSVVDEDDSVGVMTAHCAGIAGNVASQLSSEPSGEGDEAFDHGTRERDYVAPKNEGNANEEKCVVASDDEKMDAMVDRSIDGEIAALAVAVASMDNELSCETNAGETEESLADQHCKSFFFLSLTYILCNQLSMFWL